MSKAIYSINLDLCKTRSQLSLAARQGDTNREVHITLHEDGQAYKIERDVFAVLSTVTPDGNVIEDNCIIKDSKIIYAFTDALTAKKGIMDIEIRIFDKNSELITSPTFTLVVDPRAAVGDKIVKSDSFKMLDELYSETVALKSRLEGILSESDATTLAEIIKDLKQNKNNLDNHIARDIVSENGAHNFRIKDNALEFYNGTKWVNISVQRDYSIMSVIINPQTQSPDTSLVYFDDAKDNMTAGSPDWDSFFGHYPVLIRNGKEAGRLQTSDFSKFEDGTPITDFNSATDDICIAFPRRGIRFEHINGLIKVSMTDHPDLYGFSYNAHSFNNNNKNIFYLGAYLSSTAENADGNTVISSAPQKDISIINTLTTAKEYAANKNAYLLSYYQWLYLQCMLVLKYKNFDAQRKICRGFTASGTSLEGITTGVGDSYGMDSSLLSETQRQSGNYRAKLFGLEDIYGTYYQWLDCIVSGQLYAHIFRGGNLVQDSADLPEGSPQGYINGITGTNDTGFFPTSFTGSNSTYYTDWGVMYPSSRAIVGGSNTGGYGCGLFCFRLGEKPTEEEKTYDKAVRIMYL